MKRQGGLSYFMIFFITIFEVRSLCQSCKLDITWTSFVFKVS